ncbi:MAG: Flp family type IVb pilin [Candidatus Binataceae bacterium]
MEFLTRYYIRRRESLSRAARGQTMTEYALILAAIAIVVYTVMQTMGTSITAVITSIRNSLNTAATGGQQ